MALNLLWTKSLMKKPSPYPLISWAMDLKLTPVLNSIRDRHVQAAAVPAAAVDDDLKIGGNFMTEVFKQDFMDVIKERRTEFTGYLYTVRSCFER